jgi:hypothetical protein
MIIQSENPIRMVRELKGAPLSIIFALMCVKQRVNREWLEGATGYTDKTISRALAYLKEASLVDHTTAGWHMVRKNVSHLPLITEVEEGISKDDPSEEHPDRQKNEELPGRTEEQKSGPPDKTRASRNNSESFNNLTTVVVEEINKLNTPSTTDLNLSLKDGKIQTLDEIQMVMDAAEVLFGHKIMGDLADYTNIDRLLSWIAQAYRGWHDESGRLKIQNPAGLVYWAFHQGKGKAAEKKYLDINQLWEYLPESFMRASGQWEFEEDDERLEKIISEAKSSSIQSIFIPSPADSNGGGLGPVNHP